MYSGRVVEGCGENLGSVACERNGRYALYGECVVCTCSSVCVYGCECVFVCVVCVMERGEEDGNV